MCAARASESTSRRFQPFHFLAIRFDGPHHVAATPTGFIAEQRLQRAAEALRRHDGRSVTQIAFDIGFSDSAFFSRCFRRRFGETPSAWRDRA